MNPTLSDDDLSRLLHGSADTYDVPPDGLQAVLAATAGPPSRGRLPKRSLLLTGAAGVVAVAALLAQTGGTSGGAGTASTSSSVSAGKVAGQRMAPAPDLAVPAVGSAPAALGARPAAGPVTGLPAGSARTGPAAADGARVVKTGSVVLQARPGKVSATVDAVVGLAARSQGYVSTSSTQESGSNPSGTVTLRVPEASYEGVLRQVRGLGDKVVSATSSGRDVTAAYADTQAQIGSLTAARSRFLVILSRAATIGETLAVQQRVDDVQGQIDRLLGARRVLADQSSLATLEVTVTVPGGLEPTPRRGGLSQAWDDAVHGFTTGVEGIVRNSGRVLVVLLFLGLLAVVGRLGWRAARRAIV